MSNNIFLALDALGMYMQGEAPRPQQQAANVLQAQTVLRSAYGAWPQGRTYGVGLGPALLMAAPRTPPGGPPPRGALRPFRPAFPSRAALPPRAVRPSRSAMRGPPFVLPSQAPPIVLDNQGVWRTASRSRSRDRRRSRSRDRRRRADEIAALLQPGPQAAAGQGPWGLGRAEVAMCQKTLGIFQAQFLGWQNATEEKLTAFLGLAGFTPIDQFATNIYTQHFPNGVIGCSSRTRQSE